MIPPEALESATQRWGRELFHLAKAEHDQLSQLNPWVRRVLRWSLSDIEAPEVRLPPALRLGIALTHPQALTARAVTHVTHWMVTQIAHQFICGTSLDEAFASIQRLETQGMGFTLDLVGETTISEREADRYREAYLTVLEGLIRLCQSHPTLLPWYGTSPRVNLSIKLSSLTSRFDAIQWDATCEAVLARLLPIVELAKTHEAFINIDMEQYQTRALTIEVLQRLLHHPSVAGYPHVGIAIQAYLRDSEAELRDLLTWLATHDQPLTVRLVKGAYWDAEVVQARQRHWPVPVFLQKAETDSNFERLTELLLTNHHLVRTAIASHNIRSLAHALAVVEVLQVPPSRLEFQLLYGMADAIKQALSKLHQPVRVYAPYGELIPGMAYLIRRLLENTSNDSFLKHDFLHEASEEELLRVPK
ncbi:MAG: proline dehydrogenase family protein [Elusimicrobia bacterium]|nr:proline dehydrogenase family protein [Elusimicrobiota bacterium]